MDQCFTFKQRLIFALEPVMTNDSTVYNDSMCFCATVFVCMCVVGVGVGVGAVGYRES